MDFFFFFFKCFHPCFTLAALTGTKMNCPNIEETTQTCLFTGFSDSTTTAAFNLWSEIFCHELEIKKC